MRRTMGATMLIMVLGGATVVAWWSGRTAEKTPVDTVRTTPDSTLTPAARPAPPAGIDFLADPLAFLSTAPADSLELLPGVGPVLATRIVAARRDRGPFRSWDDVDRVRGIGPRTIERLKALSTRL
ncbi:MAG TPA: helix-hairpin-helix domain-containing protein [Candidatus Krumholzibacteria bacterium]|nr:helix-hairpin-helix domain-containing protein [Candidatus Krumholzibacteria bacterium]